MLPAMRSETKSALFKYFDSLRYKESEAVKLSRSFARELSLDRISLGELECRILALFISLQQPKKFVEIGTLTGTTALTILENMPEGGELWTLEKEEKHLDDAKKAYAAAAGSLKNKKMNFVFGDARESLKTLSVHGPFDGIFIDGNKAAYKDYLDWTEQNLRQGGLILADNVFLSGSVFGDTQESKFSAKQIEVMREVNLRLSDPKFYESAIVPTDEGLFVARKMF
jgi:predicted O-methyltransferase YrrM